MHGRQRSSEPQRSPSPQPASQALPRSRPFSDSTEIADQSQADHQLEKGHDFGQIPLYAAGVQAKLTVGEPNDQYEQEADRVADQVVNMPAPGEGQSIQRQNDDELRMKPLVNTITPRLQREALPNEEDDLHRKPTDSIQRESQSDEDELQRQPSIQREVEGSMQASDDLENRLSQSKSGGSALGDDVRSLMEPRFGADFSQVRVHTDSQSVQMNRELGAQAFTQGSDIYFGAGKYDPSSQSGQHLLAHELTHVVQQTGAQAAPASTVQRDLVDDFVMGARNVYHDIAEGVGLETHDEAEAARLEAFKGHGMFGPQSLVPPTNIGGFDASYDPNSQQLFIQVKTGVDFINGLGISGGVITSNHPDLNQAAIDGNTLPVANRAAFVNDFTWNRAQERDFLTQLRTRVLAAWDGKYSFFCTRPGWESVVADVVVDVDVHRGAATGDEHLQTTVYKVPDSGRYEVGAFVDGDRNTAGAFDQDPHNNGLTLSSTHVRPNPDNISLTGQPRNLLHRTIFFDHDSAILTPAAQGDISQFANDFQDANLDLTNPVQLVGRASTPGSNAYNDQLAQKRIEAVRGELSRLGFTGMSDRVSTQNMGETGATEDPEWRRVDMVVGDGQGQVVAAHEFGHVFGLMDEYAINPGGRISGTGNPTGTIVGHDAMAREIGAGGAIAENNDNIMSLGNNVRPQHYATFGWALSQVTGIHEWQVG